MGTGVLVGRLRKLKHLLAVNLKLVGSNRHSSFRNLLSAELAEEICTKLNNAFPKGRVKPEDLKVAVDLFNKIRAKIIGRIGNDVDDYVINYFMRKLAAQEFDPSDPGYAHVEIGVFFGGGAIVTLQALKDSGCRHSVIEIDPLDGYYLRDNASYSGKHDPLTKMPVNLKTVKENISRCDLDAGKAVFVEDYSQSERALEVTGKYRVASIFIDGDHAYKGLKEDFYNYLKFVVPGGYILIDNYKDNHFLNHFWPDVSKFIECELIPFNETFRIILIHNRCVLLKKLK